MRFVYLCNVLLLAAAAFGQTTCSKPRVRRAWSHYSAEEKALYIDAVALSMKNGYHQRFVEIHMEPTSEREAHGCLFFYWHRAFLFAYENMLRSLDSKYACITIPFWDYATIGSKFQAGSCKNMLDCGPLLKDFGGSLPRGRRALSQSVNGAGFQSDNCVSSAMTKYFCQSTSAFTSKSCYNCMPRNDWSKVSVPPDVNVLNIFNNILGASQPTLSSVTSGVQYGTHNMVHAVLDSVMGTFASPSDPVFYSHHATVDAMHAIYYKCIVGADSLKADNSKVWSSCRNYIGKTIVPGDIIAMKVGETGTRTQSIWTATSSPIYKFFKDLKQTYPDYADISKLGYSYDFSDTALDGMYTNCKKFKPSKSLFLEEMDEKKHHKHHKAKKAKKEEGSVEKDCLSKEFDWIDEATTLASKYYTDPSDVYNQVHIMTCVYYNECRGGVYDYSDEFKENFRVEHGPPCKRVIDDLARGDCAIGVPNWEKIMLKHYQCDSPSEDF
ncbi:hypothetical protein THRCLA_05856 [Thraustotheca clavata]|uniref:Tyrosinase copper-binding domain-containing protein n=1 Tax=Thraustotheca clavata TaxID=74557 RepID=A0A1V9ZSP1_9STRA|nr:hypothetical protein THRCLA_05856 [Thraustotheca clavata]